MSKPIIVISGTNGQLGNELKDLSVHYNDLFSFVFTGRGELDLGKPATIPSFFAKYKPSFFINCAAYTAVDKAETEQEAAYIINAESVGILAQQCRLNNSILITVSTDYVFNGKGIKPYQVSDNTEPVNYYGYTKWIGEKLALENNLQTIIIRSSWVYSAYGNNFVKTMMRLMNERKEISVVNDQIGCPTYAADLADTILQIVVSMQKGNKRYGIYQYSNKGVISWYDFAVAIAEMTGSTCKVLPISASAYPTPAKRPAYSVMDATAIMQDFNIELKDWKQSLRQCLSKLLS